MKTFTAPGAYDPQKSDKVLLDNAPKYSFGLKTQMEKPIDTPAPGTYDPDKSDKILDNAPKYSFGLKTQVEKLLDTPAPNVYKIPGVLGSTKEGNKCSAPAFSLSGRSKEQSDDRILTPGPGTYNSTTEVLLPKSPAYSVAARLQTPSDNSAKPGPGTYSPEKTRIDLPPAHTFGIKHSTYLGCLKTAL